MGRRLLHSSATCVGALALTVLPTLTGTAAHPQSTSSGRIVGHVRLASKPPGRPLATASYPRRTIGDYDAPPLPEIRNVVVYIKDAAFRGALTPSRTVLRQEHETFVPHTVAITRGSTVDFPNGDPFFHNVFSLSRAANFNLGRYKSGQTRGREFPKAGTVKVYCDIHSHMSATILVFDHPYFAIPDQDGTFELANVPAGDYTIVGWHERVGERAERVQVNAGRTTSIELTVPVPPVSTGGDAP
jgi:plastocyanin